MQVQQTALSLSALISCHTIFNIQYKKRQLDIILKKQKTKQKALRWESLKASVHKWVYVALKGALTDCEHLWSQL